MVLKKIMFFICTLCVVLRLFPKQVFKALWPFKSFVTFVCPSSLLAVCTQTVYVEEAYFVYKDYSSRAMFLQSTRLFTLTIERSVPFALGWLFMYSSYVCMKNHEKRYCRFLQWYRYIDNWYQYCTTGRKARLSLVYSLPHCALGHIGMPAAWGGLTIILRRTLSFDLPMCLSGSWGT